MRQSETDWREFERAVAAFVAALDSNAIVKHNAKLPDRHHGRLRQRDVWIEAHLCGHFPVSVLVSCKHLRRCLHSADIDAFNGELMSSQAKVGVLYSYSGFTQNAIEKAKVLGISCCRLYRAQPPEIPAVLFFTAYCCKSQILLSLSPYPNHGEPFTTWQSLFDLRVASSTGAVSLLDEIVALYYSAEKAVIAQVRSAGGIPQPFEAEVRVPPRGNRDSPIHVTVMGRWKFYRARLEAYEVKGSYEFTRGDFKGQIATPFVDRYGTEPGPGWEPIIEPPVANGNFAMIILYHGNAKDALTKNLGPKRIAAVSKNSQPDQSHLHRQEG